MGVVCRHSRKPACNARTLHPDFERDIGDCERSRGVLRHVPLGTAHDPRDGRGNRRGQVISEGMRMTLQHRRQNEIVERGATTAPSAS